VQVCVWGWGCECVSICVHACVYMRAPACVRLSVCLSLSVCVRVCACVRVGGRTCARWCAKPRASACRVHVSMHNIFKRQLHVSSLKTRCACM
jgi:hypothetical protein